MQILTHKPDKSSKSDESVKVILLDTPGKQATIGIIMPKIAETEQPRTKEYKQFGS